MTEKILVSASSVIRSEAAMAATAARVRTALVYSGSEGFAPRTPHTLLRYLLLS
jgi:hypothetical protein